MAGGLPLIINDNSPDEESFLEGLLAFGRSGECVVPLGGCGRSSVEEVLDVLSALADAHPLRLYPALLRECSRKTRRVLCAMQGSYGDKARFLEEFTAMPPSVIASLEDTDKIPYRALAAAHAVVAGPVARRYDALMDHYCSSVRDVMRIMKVLLPGTYLDRFGSMTPGEMAGLAGCLDSSSLDEFRQAQEVFLHPRGSTAYDVFFRRWRLVSGSFAGLEDLFPDREAFLDFLHNMPEDRLPDLRLLSGGTAREIAGVHASLRAARQRLFSVYGSMLDSLADNKDTIDVLGTIESFFPDRGTFLYRFGTMPRDIMSCVARCDSGTIAEVVRIASELDTYALSLRDCAFLKRELEEYSRRHVLPSNIESLVPAVDSIVMNYAGRARTVFRGLYYAKWGRSLACLYKTITDPLFDPVKLPNMGRGSLDEFQRLADEVRTFLESFHDEKSVEDYLAYNQ